MVGEGGLDVYPLGWVTPGPLRQVTGGYLYDGRIVDGLRARGHRVGVLDIRSSGWPLDLAAGRRLVAGLRRERWSSVVVDELAHPALAAALLTCRLRPALAGAPLVLLVHHLRCSEPDARGRRALARVVEGLAVQAADLVICTSETTARTVRPLARRGVQTAVVRPGWDTHGDFTPQPPLRRGEGEKILPLSAPERGLGGEVSPESARAIRLLLVGHWTPRKGILDALAALQQTSPEVTLDLVGEQDRDAAYAAQVRAALRAPALKDRVRVHGRVAADALAQRFAEADALLLTSSHEGYGMVLAEALVAGLPIVATRVGAAAEVVRDGQEAELVPPGDPAVMAQAIMRLARSPAERQRRSALARERAASLPTWSDSILAFERLLNALPPQPRALSAYPATRQAG